MIKQVAIVAFLKSAPDLDTECQVLNEIIHQMFNGTGDPKNITTPAKYDLNWIKSDYKPIPGIVREHGIDFKRISPGFYEVFYYVSPRTK